MFPHTTGEKIALMIIGAQKAGTTSLKNYLGQNPALCTHPQKEFSFFFDAEEYAGGIEQVRKRYFPGADPKNLLLAKNAGLYVNETATIRLKEHNPACRLILILRNPVNRTYSSFLMEKNYGAIREPFDIIESIATKGDITDWRYEFFVRMGMYADHLEMIYRYFPKEALKIIRYENLDGNPVATCQEIFRWIGIDDKFVPDTTIRHNATHVNRSHTYSRFIKRLLSNRNPVKKIARKILPGQMDYKMGEILRNINKSGETYDDAPQRSKDFLCEFFKPYNERLSKMTGIDFSDWNNSAPSR